MPTGAYVSKSNHLTVVPGGIVGLLDIIVEAGTSSFKRHRLATSNDNRYFVECISVNKVHDYLLFNHPPNHREIISTYGQQDETKFVVTLIDKNMNTDSNQEECPREALVVKVGPCKNVVVFMLPQTPVQYMVQMV